MFLFAVTGFVWWTRAQRTGEALTKIIPAFLAFSHSQPFKDQKLWLFPFFPLHPRSKEYGVILDTMVPLETLVNLETRDHQDYLVHGGWMESVEFLECQAFRVHQWVRFTLISSMFVWLLIGLFSAGTWRNRPTYCWSGPEDVAGWVPRPKYSVVVCCRCSSSQQLNHHHRCFFFLITTPCCTWQRGWQQWQWAPRGLSSVEQVWWVRLGLLDLQDQLAHRDHMVYLVLVAFLVL